MFYRQLLLALLQSEDRKKFPPRGSLHLWVRLIIDVPLSITVAMTYRIAELLFVYYNNIHTHTHTISPARIYSCTHTHTQGAMVAPSEEDSQSFSINGSNGEVYRLKAADAKERQFWVSRVRREVEACTNKNNREVMQTYCKLIRQISLLVILHWIFLCVIDLIIVFLF